jgi:hypothetical protein
MPTNWNAVMPTINIIKQYKEHSHIYTGTNPKHFLLDMTQLSPII